MAQTNNRNRATGCGGIVVSFIKAGPWAVLLVIVLVAVWWEFDTWISAYLNAQERYVAQGAEGVIALRKSTDRLSYTVEMHTKSLVTMEEDVRISREQVQKMVGLMSEANKLMSGVPDRSKQVLIVLEQIEQLLTKLDQKQDR